MTGRERFLSCVRYGGVDRPPCSFSATWAVARSLMAALGVDGHEPLLRRLGVDMRFVSPRYVGPPLRDFGGGVAEGLWGERSRAVMGPCGEFREMTHMPYAGVDDLRGFAEVRFPSPDWFDCSRIAEDADELGGHAVALGYQGASNPYGRPGYSAPVPAAPDYINGPARLMGRERALVGLALRDPVYMELMDRKHELLMAVYERALKAGKGKVDALFLADDLGGQEATLISPETFDGTLAGRYRDFIGLGHRYGAVVMMHMCGSVRALLPRLIGLGLDVLDVVQPEAGGMGIESLREAFHGRIAFSGTMGLQRTLPFGTEDEVRGEVGLRRRLFPEGGIIIGPSNNLQGDIPIGNILAMYGAVGGLTADMD